MATAKPDETGTGLRVVETGGVAILRLRRKAGAGLPTLGQVLETVKTAKLDAQVQLQPHQERVREKFSPDGDGTRLLLYHALGSGKTLSGLAAADAAGGDYLAVTPASLRGNFHKEEDKFLPPGSPRGQVISRTALGAGAYSGQPDTLIVDEAHALRNQATKQTKAFNELAGRTRNLVLMSGTPVVNDPSDFAPLYNALTKKHLSTEAFRHEVVDEPDDGFFGLGAHGERIRRKILDRDLAGKVDYYAPQAPPVKVREQTVTTEMSPEQAGLYRDMYAKIPLELRNKLEAGTHLTRGELSKMTSFLAGPRQVGLSTLPFHKGEGLDPVQAFDASPKLVEASKRLQARLGKDPAAKALVFSNFIGAGLTPYEAALRRAGVQVATFSGKLNDTQRRKLVDDYNENRIRVALLGPSGTEGLSFKGTRLIQQLDPHWNEVRGRQSTGRGVRFDSHTDLPEDQRNVDVERYVSRLPDDRSWLKRLVTGNQTRPGADDRLMSIAAGKEKLDQEFLNVLRDIGSRR